MPLIHRFWRGRQADGAGRFFGPSRGPDFAARAPNYLFQCGLATASLIVILLVEDAVARGALVVASASTAFIVFVVPHSIASSPQRVIGGHLVAVIGGSIFALILTIPALEPSTVRDVVAGFAVGVSILAMVLTDTEHPPAAGTALALVLGWSWSSVAFILASALIFTAMRLALRPRMVNLL